MVVYAAPKWSAPDGTTTAPSSPAPSSRSHRRNSGSSGRSSRMRRQGSQRRRRPSLVVDWAQEEEEEEDDLEDDRAHSRDASSSRLYAFPPVADKTLLLPPPTLSNNNNNNDWEGIVADRWSSSNNSQVGVVAGPSSRHHRNSVSRSNSLELQDLLPTHPPSSSTNTGFYPQDTPPSQQGSKNSDRSLSDFYEQDDDDNDIEAAAHQERFHDSWTGHYSASEVRRRGHHQQQQNNRYHSSPTSPSTMSPPTPSTTTTTSARRRRKYRQKQKEKQTTYYPSSSASPSAMDNNIWLGTGDVFDETNSYYYNPPPVASSAKQQQGQPQHPSHHLPHGGMTHEQVEIVKGWAKRFPRLAAGWNRRSSSSSSSSVWHYFLLLVMAGGLFYWHAHHRWALLQDRLEATHVEEKSQLLQQMEWLDRKAKDNKFDNKIPAKDASAFDAVYEALFGGFPEEPENNNNNNNDLVVGDASTMQEMTEQVSHLQDALQEMAWQNLKALQQQRRQGPFFEVEILLDLDAQIRIEWFAQDYPYMSWMLLHRIADAGWSGSILSHTSAQTLSTHLHQPPESVWVGGRRRRRQGDDEDENGIPHVHDSWVIGLQPDWHLIIHAEPGQCGILSDEELCIGRVVDGFATLESLLPNSMMVVAGGDTEKDDDGGSARNFEQAMILTVTAV